MLKFLTNYSNPYFVFVNQFIVQDTLNHGRLLELHSMRTMKTMNLEISVVLQQWEDWKQFMMKQQISHNQELPKNSSHVTVQMENLSLLIRGELETSSLLSFLLDWEIIPIHMWYTGGISLQQTDVECKGTIKVKMFCQF